jgi:TolA-binding protein
MDGGRQCPDDLLLRARRDHVSEFEWRAVEAHLGQCSSCRASSALAALFEAVPETLPEDNELLGRVLNRAMRKQRAVTSRRWARVAAVAAAVVLFTGGVAVAWVTVARRVIESWPPEVPVAPHPARAHDSHRPKPVAREIPPVAPTVETVPLVTDPPEIATAPGLARKPSLLPRAVAVVMPSRGSLAASSSAALSPAALSPAAASPAALSPAAASSAAISGASRAELSDRTPAIRGTTEVLGQAPKPQPRPVAVVAPSTTSPPATPGTYRAESSASSLLAQGDSRYLRLDAGAMFAQANAVRRSGDLRRAIGLYQALRRDFPESSESRLATVSEGDLLLGLGDAAGAIVAYDMYLRNARGGSLMEEALFGRARCLAGLRRATEERQAWEELMRRFPQSAYQTAAAKRLAELGN